MKTTQIITMLVLSAVLIPSVFADNWVSRLSEEEYQSILGYKPPKLNVERVKDPSVDHRDFPVRFDWRDLGGVSTVKNQAQCGSCWAFTAVAVMESQLMINEGDEYDLSEQQLVDCAWGNYGCSGGDYESAWDYIGAIGLTAEGEYPYVATDQECQASDKPKYVTVLDWIPVAEDDNSIKAALQDYGPVATVIGANDNLKQYTSGCYEDGSMTQINHGVVIVGWDDDICDGGSWIVKNSWGESWGDSGFFHIHRGDVHIGEQAAVPIVELIPEMQLAVSEVNLDDGNDNRIEGGETLLLTPVLTNIGRVDIPGATGQLSTDSEYITIVDDTVEFSALPMGESAGSMSAFEVEAAAGLDPATHIVFTLRITSGEIATDVNFDTYSGPIFLAYQSQFEGLTDAGWTHNYTRRRDDWERSITPEDHPSPFDPSTAYSGEFVWGNNLNYGGFYLSNTSNYLQSPVIDCTGFTRTYLSFQRFLSVERGIYDQARILVNGTEIWTNDLNRHHVDTGWVHCTYDISTIVASNPMISVMFTLDTDEGLAMGGWNIDDISVFTGVDAPFRNRFTDHFVTDIVTSQAVYSAGDMFELTYTLRNYDSAELIDEWIILDVYGQYWFWPEWLRDPSSREREMPAYSSCSETILTFEWPEVTGHADGIRFWSGITNSQTGAIYDYGYTEWGW